MSTEPVLRFFGHPGLRQICANVNIDKITHGSIREICNHLKTTMAHNNIRSLSAPQIGYKYRIFAMETIFYEDFTDEKSDFENLFLKQPQNENEFDKQTEGLNAYLHQLEYHLSHNVPYKTDLEQIEKNLDYGMENEINYKIFINPSWIPLDLDQSIFEMEQNKGNILSKSSEGSSNFYSTLLFGCNGIRTSCNYEQCASFPELMIKKKRYNRIRVEYYNENGDKKLCYLKSNDARTFQHECDHLDGRLLIDDVGWTDDNNSVIYIDEYLRRQNILRPQIEYLLQQFGPSQQDDLYKVYDPLHPPTDEELIEILQSLIKQQKQQKEKLLENQQQHSITNDIN